MTWQSLRWAVPSKSLQAWRWYRYEIAESGGPTGGAPSAAETCEQRKAMLELHSNSKWIHRVHLTLLRKHFTVRVRVDLGLCSFYLEWWQIRCWKAKLQNQSSYSDECLTWMTRSLRAHDTETRNCVSVPTIPHWELRLTLWIMWKQFNHLENKISF